MQTLSVDIETNVLNDLDDRNLRLPKQWTSELS